MATLPNRVAANRVDATKSTGPKSPESKARSSHNARKHPFHPDPFTILRIEDRDQIAALVADARPPSRGAPPALIHLRPRARRTPA